MGWQKSFHLWRTDFCWKLCGNMGNLKMCQGQFFLRKQRNISDSFAAWILVCRCESVVITPINIFNLVSIGNQFKSQFCNLLWTWLMVFAEWDMRGSMRSRYRAAKERKQTWSSEVNRWWLGKHQKTKMFGVRWQNESKPTAERWCHPVLLCLLERCHFSKFLLTMGHSKSCSYNIKWVLFEEKQLRWVKKCSCLSSKFLSFGVQMWTQRCQVSLRRSGVLESAEGKTSPFPLKMFKIFTNTGFWAMWPHDQGAGVCSTC